LTHVAMLWRASTGDARASRSAYRRRRCAPRRRVSCQREKSTALESAAEERAMAWLRDVPQDVRYAIRTLRSSPSFAVVAILTLALGIGATAAIYRLAD